MHKKEENMALNSNQITVWKDKNNIKTIGTGSIKNESDQYTNFSLSEVYTKDGKMLGLGLNMQVALYYPNEAENKIALNTNYKKPINISKSKFSIFVTLFTTFFRFIKNQIVVS